MKKIEVIFRPEKLEPLKETLLEAGIRGQPSIKSAAAATSTAGLPITEAAKL